MARASAPSEDAGGLSPSWIRPWMLVLASACLHLAVCPHTKVEESFNAQSMHDVLFHGVANVSQYDHLQFPGVVPRTFLGPLVVSALSFVPCRVVQLMGASKIVWLYIVRFALGLLVSSGFAHFHTSLRPVLGRSHPLWHAMVTASQFHVPFYMTRPLPNIFALCLTLHALAFWLRRRDFSFVLTAAAAVVVFRGELALLFGTIVLTELCLGRMSIGKLFVNGLISLVVTLGATVAVDSYFWQTGDLMWPEGQVLYYNVILNKSSAWGTEPWPWYFSNCLPRALCLSLPLVPLGVYLERRTLRLAFPSLTFVLLYSFLPHKETRFVVYAFPMLNASAAAACDHLWRRRRDSWWRALLALGAAGHLLGNLAFSGAALALSARNYPGGEAMLALHERVSASSSSSVHVHLDNLACQTGASRFAQLEDSWTYDKTEGISLKNRLEDTKYTHLIIEYPTKEDRKDLYKDFKVLAEIHKTAGISVDWRSMPPIHFRSEPALLVLERKTADPA